MKGKRHTLPNPTAEPAVARIMPIRLAKFPLVSFISESYFSFCQLVKEDKEYAKRTYILDKEEVQVEESATQSAPVGELVEDHLMRHKPANEDAGEETDHRQEYLPRNKVKQVKH
jgi:hypothetical protein